MYKSLKTQFTKADYTSNGLIQSGKKYDEYVDNFEYYLTFNTSNTFVKVELKEKAIKKVLVNNEQKVGTFFEMHRSNKLTESMLAELILYLNE